jgi:hypothetical protein
MTDARVLPVLRSRTLSSQRRHPPFNDGGRRDPIAIPDGDERRRFDRTAVRMARVQQHER